MDKVIAYFHFFFVAAIARKRAPRSAHEVAAHNRFCESGRGGHCSSCPPFHSRIFSEEVEVEKETKGKRLLNT